MVCKRSENQGQLTILEKELVTGSEREELGLPSAKSSSCPLTVLITEPQEAGIEEKGEEGKLKTVAGVLGVVVVVPPTCVGGDRANQKLALSSMVSPGATAVKPRLAAFCFFKSG